MRAARPPSPLRTLQEAVRAPSGAPSPRAATRLTPKPSLLSVPSASVGLAAAGTTVALGVANEEVDHVAIRVFLNDWITLNFIGAGLIAWWRRPDSRFGPLMIAAGYTNFLATLDWATAALPYTIGAAVDLLPPLLFLHVFLAYPSGRLHGRFERGDRRRRIRGRGRAGLRADGVGRCRAPQT